MQHVNNWMKVPLKHWLHHDRNTSAVDVDRRSITPEYLTLSLFILTSPNAIAIIVTHSQCVRLMCMLLSVFDALIYALSPNCSHHYRHGG
jgi:hypothetical protein